MKDEALAPVIYMMDTLPVAQPTEKTRTAVHNCVERLFEIATNQSGGQRHLIDWLRADFDIEKASQKLQDVAALDEDALVAEVQKARGKKQPLSVAQTKALKD